MNSNCLTPKRELLREQGARFAVREVMLDDAAKRY